MIFMQRPSASLRTPPGLDSSARTGSNHELVWLRRPIGYTGDGLNAQGELRRTGQVGKAGLKQVEHVLAVVVRIADEAVVRGVDDEIQVLERNVPDDGRHAVEQLHHVGRTVAPLDGE